jgi:hypothetical protein
VDSQFLTQYRQQHRLLCGIEILLPFVVGALGIGNSNALPKQYRVEAAVVQLPIWVRNRTTWMSMKPQFFAREVAVFGQ